MPKVVDHGQRRADIAAAACDAIAERGMDAVTLGDIAGAAGCTTGAVTHYFPNKDEVLLAALGHAASQTAGRIHARVTRDPTDLQGVLEETLPLDGPRRAEWRVWVDFWARAAHDERLGREQEARYRNWHRSLVAVLEQAVPAGMRGRDADAVAHDLMALVDGIGIRALIDPHVWTPAYQRDALRRYLAGILDR